MSTPKALFIEDVCPICRDDFGVDLPMWNIACGHIFCCECLFGLDPKVCPLCREEFEEADIDCVGPFEEQNNLGSEADEYETEDEGQRSYDDDDWTPSEYEREEDSAAWDEFERGSSSGEDVDDDELNYVLDRVGELRVDEDDWAPSDDALEEDLAARRELAQEGLLLD